MNGYRKEAIKRQSREVAQLCKDILQRIQRKGKQMEKHCGLCVAYVFRQEQPVKSNTGAMESLRMGECKMNPPTVQLVMVPQPKSPANPHGAPGLTAQGFWPPVREVHDCCQKFQPRVVN